MFEGSFEFVSVKGNQEYIWCDKRFILMMGHALFGYQSQTQFHRLNFIV